MEDQTRYLEDLKAIREIMQRSTRFISLSGLSGIVAGIIALVAAYFASSIAPSAFIAPAYEQGALAPGELGKLIALAVVTVLIAIASAVVFTLRKAQKNREAVWNIHFRQLLAHLALPLVSGGIISLFLAFNGSIGMVPAMMLIFYGLALTGASKYTLRDIFGLGLAEIVLGLIGLFYPGYGLLFWAMGFGIMHIIYGIRMYLKYGE